MVSPANEYYLFDIYVPSVVGNGANNDNGLTLVGFFRSGINGLCHYP